MMMRQLLSRLPGGQHRAYRLVAVMGVAVVLGVGVLVAVLRPTSVRTDADGDGAGPFRSPGPASTAPDSSVRTGLALKPGQPAAALITNEYAFHHPGAADAVRSPDWIVTSGSLYSAGGLLWSGHPDDRTPGPTSAAGTDSAVLRAVSTRTDHGNVRVSFGLRILQLSQTPRTPARNVDGVHIFLHYQSEFSTYYVSVFRRDGQVTIKKKVPGGPSNGGTYFTLASAALNLDAGLPGTWHRVEATVARSDSGLRLTLLVDGRATLDAVDGGTDAPVIAASGRVGLRGDNTEFYVRDFRADPLADQ